LRERGDKFIAVDAFPGLAAIKDCLRIYRFAVNEPETAF
jgi:hypothetical protein